jgi:SAM-dependent methyltransferase
MYPLTREKRHKELHTPRAKWILNSINKYGPGVQKHLILEIGAGDGGTLRCLHQLNPAIKLFAYEPNPDSDNLNHSNFIAKINVKSLNDDQFTAKFSAVISFEVLEHLLKPLSSFSAANKMLKRGGLFMCSTPNALSVEVGALKENSTTLDIEHISILTPAAINILCEETGFELLNIETPGNFDLELLDDYYKINNLFNISDHQKKIIQKIIRDSHLSSHMRFIARKK